MTDSCCPVLQVSWGGSDSRRVTRAAVSGRIGESSGLTSKRMLNAYLCTRSISIPGGDVLIA